MSFLPFVETARQESLKEPDERKRLILFAHLIKSQTGSPLVMGKVKELSEESVKRWLRFFEI